MLVPAAAVEAGKTIVAGKAKCVCQAEPMFSGRRRV